MKPIEREATSLLEGDRRWTFAEMARELPEMSVPAELWDGELIMSPAPSFSHQETVDRMHDALKAWVRAHKLGKTVCSPVDMVLSDRRAVQPDILFVAEDRLGIIQEAVHGAADLVVEVLSPGSRRRDRIDKRDLYEQHGVKEYWLIDPEAGSIEVLVLRDGEYHLAGRWTRGQHAASSLLVGFSVNVGEILDGQAD